MMMTKSSAALHATAVTITYQVRVRFITKDASIRVNEAPIAVPTQLGRHGLSEVIQHLRGLGSKSNDDDDDDVDKKKTKAAAGGGYDFVIENQLLRCSLDKFLMATGLSTVSADDDDDDTTLSSHPSCMSCLLCFCSIQYRYISEYRN